MTQVGLADHLEHAVPRCGDPNLDRAELVEAAPPAEIEVEPPHREEQEPSGDAADQQNSEHAGGDPQPGHQPEAAKIA